MSNLIIEHNKLTAEEYIELWNSVWDGAPSLEQTKLALNNSIYRVSIRDGKKIIAMARMIGDYGLCYYIKDVVVRPEYQKRGIGRTLINELYSFIKKNGVKGTEVFVELCAVPDKVPFYEKMGFSENEGKRLKNMFKI